MTPNSALPILLLAAGFSPDSSLAVGQSTTRPTYDSVQSKYPKKLLHQPCPDVESSENHCALRLSIALEDAGLEIKDDFSGMRCRHGYARGASDLAAYLKKKWGNRDQGYSKPNSIPAGLRGKKGIILFESIPKFEGQGHIDLFDGMKGRTGTYWNAETIWFWELK